MFKLWLLWKVIYAMITLIFSWIYWISLNSLNFPAALKLVDLHYLNSLDLSVFPTKTAIEAFNKHNLSDWRQLKSSVLCFCIIIMGFSEQTSCSYTFRIIYILTASSWVYAWLSCSHVSHRGLMCSHFCMQTTGCSTSTQEIYHGIYRNHLPSSSDC